MMNTSRARLPRLLLTALTLLFMAGRASAVAAQPKATVAAELSTTALQPGQQGVIAVTLSFPKGYHAQVHATTDPKSLPTQAKLDAVANVTPYTIQFPAGVEHTYPFGKVQVYTDDVVLYFPFQLAADAKPGDITLKGSVEFQACDDVANTCFAPETVTFTLPTKVVAAGESTAANQPALFKDFDPKVFSTGPAATQPANKPKAGGAGGLKIFGRDVRDVGLPFGFAAALFVGIIMNAMPCVLPVLPLKAIGFYETSQHNRAKSLAYGFVFSLGIVSTFAALASLVLIGGHGWGEFFAKGWFVWTLVVILVLFALSQFGLYTVSLPVGIYTIEPKKDTYLGNFLFGILTAVLSTPCTAPIFPGLLAWAIAQPHSIGIGVIMTVGVGMASPYLLLSAFPGLARRVPRSGAWSELVKQEMGFLLLAVAGYFAGQRLVHGNDYMWLVFGIMLAGAIFLIARTAQLMPRARPIVIASIIALILSGSTFALAKTLTQKGQEWAEYSTVALDKSRAEQKIVILEFTANWCANCQYVRQTVFNNTAALRAIKSHDALLMEADLTTSDATGWELLRKLNPSGGIPLTAVYLPGRPNPILLASIYRPADLIAALDEAGKAK